MAEAPLADVLAAAMAAVAAFCMSRLVLAVALRRPTERVVDVVHVVMGVSMAGMLTGWLTGAWNNAWMVAFTGSTLWFGWGVARHVWSGSSSVPGTHHLPHFVASAAMVYMLVNMRWTGMAGSGMRGMAASGLATPASPVLPVIVAVLLVGSALLAAGLSFLPAVDPQPAGQLVVADASPRGSHSAVVEGGGRADVSSEVGASWVLAPWGTPVCVVAMSVAMAYMFITVRP